jgi:putative phage-type endonuclease
MTLHIDFALCFFTRLVIQEEMPQKTSPAFVTLSFEQNTHEWLSWRRQGIGASDAPVIMGQSPWQKAPELLRLKTGQMEERPANGAMQRGKNLEPLARRAYASHTGIEVEPVCVQSLAYPWMRASLDGLSADGRRVVEIKCPGEKDHQLADAGQVPEKYYAQLQHILAVTGLAEIHYWSFRFGRPLLLEVNRDDSFVSALIEKESAFWSQVCAFSARAI